MTVQLNVLIVALFVFSCVHNGDAEEPVAKFQPVGSLIASTDTRAPYTRLVSVSKVTLPLESETAEVSALPDSTVAAIRELYVWAWPLVYMSNLKQSMHMIRSAGRSGGAPVAPLNSLCMLTDAITPEFQSVPCPNRDVVYGFGLMDLKDQPVVVQVPDFGDRFWLYQIGDHRMESTGQVGKMYGTPPGFVMVVGPEWQGTVPDQITQVIRSSTNLAYVLPRVLVPTLGDGQPRVDSQLREILNQIAIYPLNKFNGQMRRKDWSQVRWYPALGRSTRERNKLVRPEYFFDDLQRVLSELETTSTEQPLAELATHLEQWSHNNPGHQAALRELAKSFEDETIQPMFDLSSHAQALPGNWHSIRNGAAFGDDYWTRTAIAKSNPFVNREQEAKYYYLEQSDDGQPLQGGQTYSLHFPADKLPPAEGFWSLTLYNANHQFHVNQANRYSVGSLTSLKFNGDGSLDIIVQPDPPRNANDANWLPSPTQGLFKLYLRLYQPHTPALYGTWIPPAALSDLQCPSTR